MDHIETCVVGAGVVGLAIARRLAQRGQQVVVLETETAIGQGVSSRNSEVIHAGIYYPAGSLKAQMCVRGKNLLYEYCEARNVPHRRCGKLIVATSSDEEATLQDIDASARANGVDDLVVWSQAQISVAEPEVRATMALFSPTTGIVSAHDLMDSLETDLEHFGGMVVCQTRVNRVEYEANHFVVHAGSGKDVQPYIFTTDRFVNAAGLGAQSVARTCDFLPPQSIPPLHLCKGNYFSLAMRNPFSHLIYPVPERSGAGLGVHATIDLGGQARFGPDVEYVDTPDYQVTTARTADYYEAVRRYFPGLPDDTLQPGYVGIRPKLQGPGEPFRDFLIEDGTAHGITGLIQLFGIESPGLTASLAIAEYIENLLAGT